MSWWAYFTVLEWIIRLVMVVVIPRRRLSPAVALAWLAIVFAAPVPGLFLYVLIGDVRLGKRRIRLHRDVIASSRAKGWRERQRSKSRRPQFTPEQEPIIRQAERLTDMPVIGGNTVDWLPDQRETIARLIADIDAARHHVHMVYYIFGDDATGRGVVEALLRAVKRGVICRVLADAAGSRGFFARQGPAARLREGGVQVWPALPVAPLRRGLARLDIRNHRKIAVIDGLAAHTGSQNIVDPDFGPSRRRTWIDLSARFTGPVVTQLQTVFLEDWAFETEEVLSAEEYLPDIQPTGDTLAMAVPTGPSHETEALPRILLTAVNSAKRNVVITTPYLILDESMMLSLAMAVDRGVTVNVVVPEASDHVFVTAAGRSCLTNLLRAGIHVYLYQPGVLHSKTVTVDDSFALLCSANLDIRSFYLNFEINMLLLGPKITGSLRAVQDAYIAKSNKASLEEWLKQPWLTRLIEDVAALVSPLL
ncbi:MAG: cardiolipin synthase [Planctomycetes bacterium]|nr:cardiolipin synthase [Planctomycetota bacterium]